MTPSDDNMRGADSAGQASSPGPGGGFPVQPPPEADPRVARAGQAVASIVSSLRQLSVMFPSVNEEVRSMLNLMPKIQAKLAQAKPAPEPSAPPV